jgi:hypothetical protein
MGLFNWIETQFTGIDAEDEQRRNDESDATIARQNQELRDRGTWTEQQYNDAETHRAATSLDVASEVNSAFVEGLHDGADNIRRGIGGTINGIVGNAFRLIPWQVWVIGALALFFYIGGPRFVFSRLLRK